MKMFYCYLLINSSSYQQNITILEFVYDSAEKQMLNGISLVIEQGKNEFDRIVRVWFSPSIFIPCEGDITFRTPARIYF
jgi:hypothetical protein